MQEMLTSAYNLLNTWIPLVWIIAAGCLFACGVGCMIPSEKIRAFCRAHILHVAFGAAITISASAIAKEITGAFTF